jgi:pseudouridine synthase
VAEPVQKLLSHAGYTSRRKAETLIEADRVTVNGDLVSLGDTATRDDTLRVNGEVVEYDDPRYLSFHKPRNVLTTLDAVDDRETIIDYIDVDERVYPAGRLDYDAEGLLILTNDGDFANTVMHPRHGKEKTYHVTVNREFDTPFPPHTVELDDGPVTLNYIGHVDGRTYEIRIVEGRKHIVKRIIQSFNRSVERLVRTKIGSVRLDVDPGEWRDITDYEIKRLSS